MNNLYPQAKARDKATLEQQIMDAGIAKNDAEWWAMSEIERLRAALQRLLVAVTSSAIRGEDWEAEIQSARTALKQ